MYQITLLLQSTTYVKTNIKQYMTWKTTLSILLLNIVLMGFLWSHLGSNYTPVNDGWFPATLYDTTIPRHDDTQAFDDCLNKQREIELSDRDGDNLFSRIIRRIPYILSGLSGSDGFLILNSMLFSFGVLTGFGIFLVLLCFFPTKPLFSLVTSLLIMYFPIGGTLFWLGAMGVNLGYLLCVYSTLFFFLSLQNNSMRTFAISLILLIACHRTYQGYIPLQAVVCGLYLLMNWRGWREWVVRSSVYVGVSVLGIIPSLLNLTQGSGREGRVADFSLVNIFDGFLVAFMNLFVFSFVELFSEINPAFFSIALIAVIGFLVMYIVRQNALKQNTDFYHPTKGDFKGFLFLIFASIAIFIAGYGPYSVTEIRYGTDRHLLFARPAMVILSVYFLFWIVGLFCKNTRVRSLVLIVVGSILLCFSLQSKVGIADEYAIASKRERIFLGDLAETIESINDDQHCFIMYLEKGFIANKRMKIMLNRPRYPIRHLLQDFSVQAVAFTRWHTKQDDFEYSDTRLNLKNKEVFLGGAMFLWYSLETGFQNFESIEHLLEKSPAIYSQGERGDTSSSAVFSQRRQWYIDERDRLVKEMGLRQ